MFNDNPIFTYRGQKFNLDQFIEKYDPFLTEVRLHPYSLLKTIPFTILAALCFFASYVKGLNSDGISFFLFGFFTAFANSFFLISNIYIFCNYFFMRRKIQKYLQSIFKLTDKQPFFNAIDFKSLQPSSKESILRDLQTESLSLGNLKIIGKRLQDNYINNQINIIENNKLDEPIIDIRFFSPEKKSNSMQQQSNNRTSIK